MNYILRNTDRMFRSSSDSESDTGPITYVSVGNLFNLPELLFPPRENGTVTFMACRGGKLLFLYPSWVHWLGPFKLD